MNSLMVNGYKVTYKNGMAEFSRFGIAIKVPVKSFSLAWAIKTDNRLEQHVVLFGSFAGSQK